MKIIQLLKILNNKINKYDKNITNPFELPHPMTIIWVENELKKSKNTNFRIFKPPNMK